MFGAHENTSSETIDDESSTFGPTRSRLAVIGLVLALVASVGWFALQGIVGDDTSAAAESACETTSVTIAVAPAMADLVDSAVAALPDNGQCIELDLVTATVADVALAQDEVREGEEDVLPDLWVPNSPSWQNVLTKAGRTGKVLVPALATTPVALASGTSDSTPASWLDVLISRPRLVMADPKASGASALALLAPFAEGDAGAAQNQLAGVAQQFGDDVASQIVGDLTIDTIEDGNDSLLPVTEQDFLIAKRGNPALQWVAPATGVGLLEFPLVQPSAGGSGIAVSTGSLDVAGRTGATLAAWFTTDEGMAAMAADKLRGPDGAPLPDNESISDEKQLPGVEKAQVDAVLKSWDSLIVPFSILALMEISDSMETPFGSSNRVQLAVDASQTALKVFPDAARLGLRAFSTNQGPGGKDWRELAPLRRMDAPLGQGETQRDLVARLADKLPTQTGGGAGLYDSILAAYQEAVLQYNPYYENSLVVFTDGPNDDPGSISLDGLKRELRTLYDPERPVRIIAIGITDNADIASLEEIASAAEKSGAYQVLKPDDILTILAATLLTRD